MAERDDAVVTPHAELPGFFDVESWSFSFEEDGDLGYIDQAIRAWTAWRAFILDQDEAPF